jgi:mannan endo-1,4-beta-mannosidase
MTCSTIARAALLSLIFGLVAAASASSAKTSPEKRSTHPLLTVAISGRGTVTSIPRGISCRSKCRRRFPLRATVRLTARPYPTWSLWKWRGPCLSRKGSSCTLRMSKARSVQAVFRLTIAVESPPHRARVLSGDGHKLLAYLSRLSGDSEPGVIVGQHCPNQGLVCDDSYFQQNLGALHDQSGRWPGILDLDYEVERVHPLDELLSTNRRLIIPYWQAGGLVSISWDPANPWGPDPQNAWRDMAIHYPGSDLRELLPGGAKRLYWLRSLDRIAAALSDLRDAGVVVLWRPMQEMNGPVYWWAKKKVSDDHAVYAKLWRDMFDYFNSVKGLDNLLWVFAPIGDPFWSSYPYPGNGYADVIAPTAYSNDLGFRGYEDALKYGKPVALSEYGPDAWGTDMGADGSFDDRLYAERLSRDYPRVAYFTVWCSWEGVKMSLADNLYASELMNDPRVTTREHVAWR